MAQLDKISRVQQMLAALDHKDNAKGIKNALRILAARTDDVEVISAVVSLGESISGFYDVENQQNDLIRSYEQYLDKKLPEFLQDLQRMINDYNSALLAVNQFDIEYFRNIPMSVAAKQSIAGTLLNLTRQYGAGDNTFWQSLINGNSNVMLLVTFHQSEDQSLNFYSEQ